MDRAFFLLEPSSGHDVGVLVVLKGRRTARGRLGRTRPQDVALPCRPPSTSAWPRICWLVGRSSSKTAASTRGTGVPPRLPDDSDVQALFDRVCALHSKRLDRCRPLWEVHVFDGLAGNRVGLYFKTHHG